MNLTPFPPFSGANSVEKILQLFATCYFRMFGRPELTPIERRCFDAWRDSLEVTARNTLEAQMKRLRLVQHQAAGAKACFYYDESKITSRLMPAVPDLHAATVMLNDGGHGKGKGMAVKIFVHRGLLFSLEFPKRPGRYIEQHNMCVDSIEVESVDTHCRLS